MVFADRNKLSELYNTNMVINNSIHFIVHYLYFLHINFYEAMNCMIMEIFSRGLSTVCFSIRKDTLPKIIDAVGTGLSLILIFIYEEVIVLNFCEFDKYVQKNVLKREEEYDIKYDINYENISKIEN